SAASRLKMPLNEMATPTLNSFPWPSAPRGAMKEPPAVVSASTPMRTAANHLAPPDLRVIVFSRSLARSRWGALGERRRSPQSRSIEQRLALTTVQRDERAVHEARPLGGHEDGHVGHLLGRADPAERDAALRPLLRFVDADLADLGDPADQIIPPGAAPALLMRMSMRWSRPTVASTIFFTSASRVRSPATANTSAPVTLPSSAAAASSSRWVRAQMATRAPSSARPRATALPIPLLPPVTSATLPFKPRSIGALLCRGRRPHTHVAEARRRAGANAENRNCSRN